MRLIVTRPRQDARPLARRLANAGHEVITTPLLSIRQAEKLAIPERRYQAVLITSANGARALGRRPELERLRGVTAFVVGPSSAAAARDAGFARVVEADGDVAGLAGRVIAFLRPDDGPLLYISGAVTAGDLASKLEAAGFEVDSAVAYEARPVTALPTGCAAALAAETADGVILFSPRTARIWATLVAAAGLSTAAARVVHYCLSENVAAAVRSGLGPGIAVEVAPRPDEAALLEMIPPPA